MTHWWFGCLLVLPCSVGTVFDGTSSTSIAGGACNYPTIHSRTRERFFVSSLAGARCRFRSPSRLCQRRRFDWRWGRVCYDQSLEARHRDIMARCKSELSGLFTRAQKPAPANKRAEYWREKYWSNNQNERARALKWFGRQFLAQGMPRDTVEKCLGVGNRLLVNPPELEGFSYTHGPNDGAEGNICLYVFYVKGPNGRYVMHSADLLRAVEGGLAVDLDASPEEVRRLVNLWRQVQRIVEDENALEESIDGFHKHDERERGEDRGGSLDFSHRGQADGSH